VLLKFNDFGGELFRLQVVAGKVPPQRDRNVIGWFAAQSGVDSLAMVHLQPPK
jgi:hypothetical protein